MLEKSCGVVLYTKIKGKRQYLLIRSGEDVYGFPKGHMEENETEKECALRECQEETSIVPKLMPFFRKRIRYSLLNGNEKDVVFFIGEFKNQSPKHMEGFEKFDYVVVPYDQAMELLSFENVKIVLKEAEKFLKWII